MNMTHLCNTTKVYVVNGQLPGPQLDVTDGDTVVVHLVNQLPHGVTIHWHGVRQLRSCWADGAGYVTECPVPPGGNRTYRFDVAGQVGTLWWHAHVTCLRASIHGAIVVRPKDGRYPFPTPAKDVPIVIGEWWQLDLVDLDRRHVRRDLEQAEGQRPQARADLDHDVIARDARRLDDAAYRVGVVDEVLSALLGGTDAARLGQATDVRRAEEPRRGGGRGRQLNRAPAQPHWPQPERACRILAYLIWTSRLFSWGRPGPPTLFHVAALNCRPP